MRSSTPIRASIRASAHEAVVHRDVSRGGPAYVSDELLVMAADALACSVPSARSAAARVVLEIVRRADGPLAAVRGADPPSVAVVLAFAAAAKVLAETEARSAIAARAGKSAEGLRVQLLALL